MTERKPADMSFPTWVEKQIQDAEERGAFDNLPLAGKPLPKSDDADEGQAWLRDYLRREGVSTEEMLPTPLRLRKESERLAETVHLLASEQHVREAVADLNERIMKWRRIPYGGPPLFVALVDEEALLTRWTQAQPPAPPDAPAASAPEQPSARPSRRWWPRRGPARCSIE